MKGKFEVCILAYKDTPREHRYMFSISRNVTVLRGDSGTGKTYIYDVISTMLRQAVEATLDTEVIISSTTGVKPQLRIPAIGSAEEQYVDVKRQHDCLFFIDESDPIVHTGLFNKLLSEGSDNYFIVCTREDYTLSGLQVAVSEIYKLVTYGKSTITIPVYWNSELITHYQKPLSRASLQRYGVLLVEDDGTGYHVMKNLFESDVLFVDSTRGKDRVYKKLKAHLKDNVIVVVDQAVFGSSILRVYLEASLRRNIVICLPESFEWIILHLSIFQTSKIREVLGNPSEYIDSSQYFSWGRFFTNLLKECLRNNYGFEYKKGSASTGDLFSLLETDDTLRATVLRYCGLKG